MSYLSFPRFDLLFFSKSRLISKWNICISSVSKYLFHRIYVHTIVISKHLSTSAKKNIVFVVYPFPIQKAINICLK